MGEILKCNSLGNIPSLYFYVHFFIYAFNPL